MVAQATMPLILSLAVQAHAAWFNAAWSCRRPIEIEDVKVDDLTATVEFFTGGRSQQGGTDIRVATDDGKPIALQLLQVGPGDRVRLAFKPIKSVRKYAVYFGNPNPEVDPKWPVFGPVHGGLLMETRVWTGGAIHTIEQIKNSFDRSKPTLGQAIVDNPFLGHNPFGDEVQYTSKLTGTFTAPTDGDYEFAAAMDDEGTVYVDDKPLVVAHLGGGNAQYHASIHLDKGPHGLTVYHVNAAGEGYFAVYWKPPGEGKFDVMKAAAFGSVIRATAGPLEVREKTLVADYSTSLASECFADDGYALRQKFTVAKSKVGGIKYEWDFGDGQRDTRADADHVYAVAGVYTVRLTARAGGGGGNSDVYVCQVPVERDYLHITSAKEEAAGTMAAATAGYDLNTLPPESLPRLAALDVKGDRADAAAVVAGKIAAAAKHADPAGAIKVLTSVETRLLETGKADAAVTVWDKVPAESDLQPAAARRGADLAVWLVGDFDKAVKLLEPQKGRADEPMRRLYGQALVLSGRFDDGVTILRGMKSPVPAARAAALSGAAARTVEFFITEKGADSGITAWDRWQAKFPDEFLEGYGVLLRTKLMERQGRPIAAAKVAEAFATAVPKSSYAPQLLDRASRLFEKTDPAKSKQLRELLKSKYPEDPLSQ